MAKMVCPHHGVQLERRHTRYGGRWSCPENDCTVVCWEGGTSTPADYDTRQARHQMHELFDPLWQSTTLFEKPDRPNGRSHRRRRAYHWLAEQMGKDVDDTHFGYFTAAECDEARQHVEALLDYVGVLEGRGTG